MKLVALTLEKTRTCCTILISGLALIPLSCLCSAQLLCTSPATQIFIVCFEHAWAARSSPSPQVLIDHYLDFFFLRLLRPYHPSSLLQILDLEPEAESSSLRNCCCSEQRCACRLASDNAGLQTQVSKNHPGPVSFFPTNLLLLYLSSSFRRQPCSYKMLSLCVP